MNYLALLQSRLALFCCCVLVFFVTAIALCGGNSLAFVAVLTSDGLIALAWFVGACAMGALILRPLKVDINRALFCSTAAGLGMGIFSLLGLALGLLGWLNRPVAIAFPVVPAIIFILDLLRRHPGKIDRNHIEQWLGAPAGAAWLWLVPMVSLAIACVSASIMPGILWKSLNDPHPYDVTSYHLLVPREWYEGGRIVPLSHNVFSYFPFNVEMQYLLLMHAMGGPWAAMYACQFLSVGYAGVMVLAVVGAIGKDERRASKSGSSLLRRSMFAFSPTLAAAFASIIPWVVMLAGVAYVESALMLYTALSIAWALHAIGCPDKSTRGFILSGVMAGLACGVKITAVPMLLIAVPTAVLLLSRRKSGLVGCASFVLAGSIVLSPWLIRNYAWCGNPLFPVGMKVLGQDHFTDQQVERFRIAHSPTPAQASIASKLNLLWKDVISFVQFDDVFFPMVAVALALCWRDRQTWLLLICGLFVLVVWIGFTHLLPRFLVMLLPIGAIAIGRMRWGRAWPAGVVVLLIGAGFGWSWMIPALQQQSNPPPFNGEPRPAFIGFPPDFMMSPELIQARDQHMQIGLVGDAQAFLYQIPMSQMHYRTVFNLQSGDPIDAWVGPQAKGDPNWFLVINPMEVDRLHTTYVGVPACPPAWAEHEPLTFYLRGDQVPK